MAKPTPKPTAKATPKPTPTPVRVAPTPTRTLTPFEKALIKANGDITKIPGWKGGKGTE